MVPRPRPDGGADGGVFVSDWCDTGECHNYDHVQPRGRIYRVSFGDPKPGKVDLAKLSDEELVKLQTHKNEWMVRHARRLLQERAAAGKLSEKVGAALRGLFVKEREVTRRLRALWAMHVTKGVDEEDFWAPGRSSGLSGDKAAEVRAWAAAPHR